MYRKIADTYVARLLMICFFLPMLMQVIALLFVATYFLTEKIIDKYKAPVNNYGWAFCLSAGYYLYLFWLPVTPITLRAEFFDICQHKLSYLLLPFLFAAISPATKTIIRNQLPWFVYGCILCCLMANSMYIYHFCTAPGALQHLFHVQYRLYIENITGIHPTYISMYLCFSICILLLTPQGNKPRTWVKYALLYLLLIFLFSLLAKAALITIFIILVHYVYVRRSKLLRYKFHIAGALLAVIGALYFIPFFGQRMGEVLQFAGIGRQGGDVKDNSMYVRKLVWNTDLQLLQQHWISGVGPAALRHMLNVRYFFFSIAQGSFVGYYDPHNEYLSEWLSFGLMGIAVLVIVLMIHIITALRRADHLYLYLMIILCITFSTETVLSRQYGVIFYSILTSLFFFTKQQRSELV